MAELLQNLQHVYARWENPGRSTSQRSHSSADSGRKAWKDKFGDNIRPPMRRHRRSNYDQIPISNPPQGTTLGRFKVMPTVFPEVGKYQRPFMGRSCSTCLQGSRNCFYDADIPRKGFVNILQMKTVTRGNMNILQRTFKYITSPFQKTSKACKYPDVTKLVLASLRLQEAIHKSATEQIQGDEGSEVRFIEALKKHKKRAKRLLDEIKATVSDKMLRLSAYILTGIMARFLRTVIVHQGQIDMVKKASETSLPLIFIPLHRSHLDYVLVTWLMYVFGVKVPHVAAGDNLNIPVFGCLMRNLGGYFIRRKLDKQEGKKDYVYRALLHEYMQKLLSTGMNLEFFIEGGRTRTGKACQPKGGLLSVVVDSYMEGVIADAYIVPVSINYEKILDGNFNHEQMGNPKIKETFWKAIKAIWKVMLSRYGSVRIDFAQPFSLKEYLQTAQVSGIRRDLSRDNLRKSGSLTSLYGTDIVMEDQRQTIKALGEHVVYTCVQSSAVMTTNLLAFLLLTKYRDGATLNQLCRSFEWLKEQVLARGRDVGFVGKTADVIEYAADLLGNSLVKREEANTVERDENLVNNNQNMSCISFYPTITLPDVFELSYYSNSVISCFLMESIIATAVFSVADGDLDVYNKMSGDTTVSREAVLERAMELCSLLKYEFVFAPPCCSIELELTEALEKLITSETLRQDDQTSFGGFDTRQRDWAVRFAKSMKYEDGGSSSDEEDVAVDSALRVNQDDQESCEYFYFLLSVLAPLLESYWFAACNLVKLLENDIPESEFLSTVNSCAKERVCKGVASYAESVSMECIKNALKAFADLNVIEIYFNTEDNIVKTVTLHEKYQGQSKLDELINWIESCKM